MSNVFTNIVEQARLTSQALLEFGHSLFDPGFVFSVSREFTQGITTPLLLMDGNDRAPGRLHEGQEWTPERMDRR